MNGRGYLRPGILAPVLLGALTVAQVQAQAPSGQPNQAPAPPVLAPRPCADVATEGRGGNNLSDGGAANQDLSQKLEQGNGVLCPPPTGDPSVQRPPNVGTTPVIPPPGSPGGDRSIQPK
jgi:hypothetical protein